MTKQPKLKGEIWIFIYPNMYQKVFILYNSYIDSPQNIFTRLKLYSALEGPSCRFSTGYVGLQIKVSNYHLFLFGPQFASPR